MTSLRVVYSSSWLMDVGWLSNDFQKASSETSVNDGDKMFEILK